jgi:hypothetical protein
MLKAACRPRTIDGSAYLLTGALVTVRFERVSPTARKKKKTSSSVIHPFVFGFLIVYNLFLFFTLILYSLLSIGIYNFLRYYCGTLSSQDY